MPDMAVVLREAFPLGSLGPTVRRWWPLVLTALVALPTAWAATAPWFGLRVGQVGVPVGFTGTGRTVDTGGHGSGVTTDGVLPWGYATAGLAIVALILVVVATVRPAFGVRGRTWASAVLGLAAVLSILLWIFPALMMSGLDDLTGAKEGGDPLFFPPKAGLVWTVVLTSVGAAVLFMGRRNRSLHDGRAATWGRRTD